MLIPGHLSCQRKRRTGSRGRLQLNQHQQKEALARRDAGEPVTEIARSYDVHHATISRLQSWQSRLAMIEPLRQKGRQT
jgi:DNA invertase Pin-like site-specific DNA recombinase